MSSRRITAGQVGEKLSGSGWGRDGPAIAAFSASFPCGIVRLAEEGGFFSSSLAARRSSSVAFPSVGREHPKHERFGLDRHNVV